MIEQDLIKDGFNRWGYDREGYNREGFNKNGYNREGYNTEGFSKDGYNREGYNKGGFNREGYDKEGYNREGFDKEGYNREGYNKKGFNRDGIHKETKSKYDARGYDANGINRDGVTKEGQQIKNFLGLKEKVQKLASGEMSITDFIQNSKISLDELIQFAKKQKYNTNTIKRITALKKDYERYKKKFDKDSYLRHTILMINGNEVRPSQNDVDRCIRYMELNGLYICDYTARKTINDYLNGRLPEVDSMYLRTLEEEQQRLSNEIKKINQLENEIPIEEKQEVT
ncbi:MAG TPA: hypothetical protein DEP51_04850 [Clostridiales bacterium]|nr:hypothetical protein [Clostridiales bacterium]